MLYGSVAGLAECGVLKGNLVPVVEVFVLLRFADGCADGAMTTILRMAGVKFRSKSSQNERRQFRTIRDGGAPQTVRTFVRTNRYKSDIGDYASYQERMVNV